MRNGHSVRRYKPLSEITRQVTLRSGTEPMRDTCPFRRTPDGRAVARYVRARTGHPLTRPSNAVIKLQSATNDKIASRASLSGCGRLMRLSLHHLPVIDAT